MSDERRTLTIGSWVKKRYADERPSWDELWMGMACMIGQRARCVRDRVGAIVVTDDNILLGVGYNGPPAGFPLDGWCDEWCPRATKQPNDESLSGTYDDCHSIHAETNCLLRLQSRVAGPATMYVTSTTCWSCAKMIASSGVTRLIMAAPPDARRRMPDAVYAMLSECGVEVAFWDNCIGGYRRTFVNEHGLGPYPCYFCGVEMPWAEAIHHLDGDHSNDDISNLVAAHSGCHSKHHTTQRAAVYVSPNRRPQYTSAWVRRKPVLACVTCGLETLPGWLRRHCAETGHDDGGAITAYEHEVAQRRLTCPVCGEVFPDGRRRGAHVMWHRRRGEIDEMPNELRGEVPQ